MESSKDQNSSIVLSLWHCMLAWFFADSANNHEEGRRLVREDTMAMMAIYKYMRPLRFAIHGHTNPQLSIPEIAEPFNFIFSRIHQDVWVNELHSLLKELLTMKHVLKDYNKQSQNSTDTAGHFNVFRIHKQPKYTICLLTLWYWLAAWSTPDNEDNLPSNHSAKHSFMTAMEFHDRMLGHCLVAETSAIPTSEQEDLQSLYCYLLEMLKSDPQHWTDVLDHFIDKMVDAGLLRGEVKKVFHAAGVLDGGSMLPPSTEAAPGTLVMHMQPKAASIGSIATKYKIRSKLGGLLKGGLKQIGINLVLDKIGDLGTQIYNDIKVPVGNFVADIPKVVEEAGHAVGHEATELALKVYHGTEHLADKIHDEVTHLAHVVGEGMHHFAEGVEGTYHKAANFFSHLFGH